MKPNKKQRRTGLIKRLYASICEHFTLNEGDSQFPTLDLIFRVRASVRSYVMGADYIVHTCAMEVDVDHFVKHGKIDQPMLIEALATELEYYKQSEGKNHSDFCNAMLAEPLGEDGYCDSERNAMAVGKEIAELILNNK